MVGSCQRPGEGPQEGTYRAARAAREESRRVAALARRTPHPPLCRRLKPPAPPQSTARTRGPPAALRDSAPSCRSKIKCIECIFTLRPHRAPTRDREI